MATNHAPIPLEIEYDEATHNVRLVFEHSSFVLSDILLRVYAPSADVRQHGATPYVWNEVIHQAHYGRLAKEYRLVRPPEQLTIVNIEPVGQYAIRCVFSDRAAHGIYSWDYLYWLGQNAPMLWTLYQQRCQTAQD